MKQNYVFKSIVLVVIIYIISFEGLFSQDPMVGLKADSLRFTADSTHVIFYKKKKNGIYEFPSKTVLIKSTKNPILEISPAHLYLQITKDGFEIDHFTNGVNRFKYTINDCSQLNAVFPTETAESYRNIVYLNNKMLNFETGEQIQTDSVDMANFQPETFFKLDALDENRLLINYYRNPIEPLLLSKGTYEIDSGFGYAGIFNKETKKWEIPPIYKTCEVKDSLLFCAIETPIFAYADAAFQMPFIWYTNAYDIYVKRADEYVLKIQNLSQLTAENLKVLLNCEQVEIMADSIHIITEKEGKKGVWQIELNHYFDDNKAYSPLIISKLLSNEHDCVFLEDETGLVFTYSANNGIAVHVEKVLEDGTRSILNSLSADYQLLYGRNYFENILVIDQEIISFNDFLERKITSISPRNSVRMGVAESRFTRSCGLKWINDSLLYCIDFKVDSVDIFAPPLRSLEYPGEDSLIYDKDMGLLYGVYPPAIRGYGNSGVWNLNSEQWFIQPIYQSITNNSNGFLAYDLFETKEKSPYLAENYTFFDRSGALVFEDIDLNEILENRENYPFIFWSNGEHVIKALPERVFRNLALEDRFREDYYVQNKEGTWQVYQFLNKDGTIQLSPITKPRELVHYNVDYNYFVYLQHDSLYLDWEDSIYSISANDGSITIALAEEAEFLTYRITLYENGVERNLYNYPQDSLREYQMVANFHIIEDQFIVNEKFEVNNLENYYVDIDEFWFYGEMPPYDYYHFISETSVVWEKKDGKWKIVSPYYASIEKCELGFLVRTGKFEQMNKTTGEVEVLNEERTLLLDSTLKPISFLDYFDFEGGTVYEFGVSLCTQNGCFLMSNTGKIITNDEWDYFEWEDGKIKAVRYNDYTIDDPLMYEEGFVYEVVAYFELP